MSASRTGRPRAACRSTNRAASTAAVASAALPTSYARDPAAGDDDRPQPAVDLEQLHERRVADLVDQPVHVEAARAGPVPLRDADQTPPVLDRLLEPGPLALQHGSSLVVVPGLGQPAVVGAQGGQQTGQLPVARRAHRVAGRAQRARATARSTTAGVRGRASTAWRTAPAGPARRPCTDASARSSVLPSVARWSSRASSPRRQACHTPRTIAALVAVERLGQPRRGPHQPRAVAPVPGGGRPQLDARRHARLRGGPAREQPRNRRVLGPCRLELRRQLARPRSPSAAPFARRRRAASTTSSARAVGDLAPLAPEAGPRASAAAARAARRVPARELAEPGRATARPGSHGGRSARQRAAADDRARLAGEPGGEQRLARSSAELDRRSAPRA